MRISWHGALLPKHWIMLHLTGMTVKQMCLLRFVWILRLQIHDSFSDTITITTRKLLLASHQWSTYNELLLLRIRLTIYLLHYCVITSYNHSSELVRAITTLLHALFASGKDLSSKDRIVYACIIHFWLPPLNSSFKFIQIPTFLSSLSAKSKSYVTNSHIPGPNTNLKPIISKPRKQHLSPKIR